MIKSIMNKWIIFPIAILFFLFNTSNMVAQETEPTKEDSTFSLDLLRTPSSPGFVLMGIEPSTVERPGNVKDLSLALLNNTSEFSVLPENFAIEFAPYWIFKGQDLTRNEYFSNTVKDNFKQSLSISFATSNSSVTSPDSGTTSWSFGLRFSLLRGDVKKDDIIKNIEMRNEKLKKINENFSEYIEDLVNNDPEILKLDKDNDRINSDDKLSKTEKDRLIEVNDKKIEVLIEEKKSSYTKSQLIKEELEAIKKLAEKIKFEREGWKWDVAAGVVYDFTDNNFDEGDLTRFGFWTTVDYEKNDLAILGTLRYLGNDSKLSEDNLDFGYRFIYEKSNNFSISYENVYRYFMNGDKESQKRNVFKIDYVISKNQVISLSVGKTFDALGEFTNKNNIVAALNLLLGFGSSRPLIN